MLEDILVYRTVNILSSSPYYYFFSVKWIYDIFYVMIDARAG